MDSIRLFDLIKSWCSDLEPVQASKNELFLFELMHEIEFITRISATELSDPVLCICFPVVLFLRSRLIVFDILISISIPNLIDS